MVKRIKEKVQSKTNITFDFLTKNQQIAWETYQANDVIFLAGPAGTGKTFLAMAFAISDILQRNHKRIILTRPIVEAGESLGHLPGNIIEKVNPYMVPLYDCYHILCPGATLKNKIIEQAFEIAPIAFMRGRSLHNSVCIFDEAQNATTAQLILFLTRLGQNSKIIITGDPQQSDIDGKSGLTFVMNKLYDLNGVGIIHFSQDDIVRHPLITLILNRLTTPFQSSPA